MKEEKVSKELPPTDVLVVGAGPTGLMLTFCLTQWGHDVRLIDNRPETLRSGRADGIQPRTLDMFVNLNLIDDFNKSGASKFDTVAFWDPGEGGNGIELTWKSPTCPSEIGARHPWTSTLHQGLIEDMFARRIEEADRTIRRPWTIVSFEVEDTDPIYPVRAVLQNLETKDLFVTRAKYLFGAQGAKSTIREDLGIPMIYHEGSLQATAWVVIDAEVETNFPGIKWKNNIHSSAGSMMVIPRENGLVRFYIQSQRPIDREVLEAEARRLATDILRPYELKIGYCDWVSTYKIGQGRAGSYGTRDRRILLGGDACHTHSPKAGQGMNTGLLDAANLAWKIHLVESGFAKRELLDTYEDERLHIAKALLEFDAQYTKLFSEKRTGKEGYARQGGADDSFIRTASQNVQFTSGHGTHYLPNMINMTRANAPDRLKGLLLKAGVETTLETGSILPSANLTRLVDQQTVHMEQMFPMNGAFRIVVFAGHHQDAASSKAFRDFAKHAVRPGSVLSGQSTTSGGSRSLKPVTFVETGVVFASTISSHVKAGELVPVGLQINPRDVYSDWSDAKTVEQLQWSAYNKTGLRRDCPAVVIVRPDNYVGCAIRLVEGTRTAEAVDAYFAGLMTKPASSRSQNGGKARL